MRVAWLAFTPQDYIRAGGWRGLPDSPAGSLDVLVPHADGIEGESHRILSFDGPIWSLELMFDLSGRLMGDQLQIAPELAQLDPETDIDAVRARLPFAYIDSVEAAPAVADVAIEAIYGDDATEDESIVFLANGINLHFQPGGGISVYPYCG